MAGIKGRSGRKPMTRERIAIIKDEELHAKCSQWLHDHFEELPHEKRIEVACKMLYKFGISKTKQDIEIKNYTEQEKQTILEFFTAMRSRALNTEGVPHATEQATSN